MSRHADNVQLSARLAIASAIALLLNACASNPYGWSKDTAASVDKTLEEAAKPTAAAVPSEVNQALLPPLEIRLPDGGTAPIEQRFDLAVNNAPARQVFMNLVDGTPYSMVVHPDIIGTVSLQLKNVTVAEAMEAIRQVYGYEYRRQDQRFYVLGRGMQTRIFPVNYLNLARKAKSETRVSTGELTQTVQSGAGTTGSAGTYGGGTTTTTIPSVRVETDSQADFWKDLRETLTALIGAKDGRQVTVNPQGGMVIVRAMPDELRMVEEYLGLTHTTLNRQVILEAKIVNVQLKDGFQTGINWAYLGSKTTVGQIGGGSVFSGSGVSDIAGNTGNLGIPGEIGAGGSATLPVSGIPTTLTSAFGGVGTLVYTGSNFAAFIELLKSQGEVHVLSSPRVAAVNNQKAVIKVGGDEFFITGVTTSYQQVGSVVQATPEVQLTPFFSGIALDVTPQIDEKSNVILHIHPSVSEVVQKNKSFIVASQPYVLPLAASSIQESDNVVRAQSGQIVVIGGLMKEGTTDENASIPLLGDIPLLGELFKHKRVTRIKSELVILLKPTIVEGAQVWSESIQNSSGTLQRFKGGGG
jgi:MSHA biogenesis protein MshL